MACHLTTRWGADERDPTAARMSEVIAQLDAEDHEHPSVALTHESGWSLSACSGGLMVWQDLETGPPHHLNGVPRGRVLELWLKLAADRIADVEAEPWLPGYQDA